MDRRAATPRRWRPPYVPPAWTEPLDLVLATAKHAVHARFAPALAALLKSRGVQVQALAIAAGVELKYLKEILANLKTPTPEILDDLISGFARLGGGVLGPEVRALDWVLGEQRRQQRAWVRDDGVSETRGGGGAGGTRARQAPRAHHARKSERSGFGSSDGLELTEIVDTGASRRGGGSQ
jgi:hypothetical protein